jgi:hypothetical protein
LNETTHGGIDCLPPRETGDDVPLRPIFGMDKLALIAVDFAPIEFNGLSHKKEMYQTAEKSQKKKVSLSKKS